MRKVTVILILTLMSISGFSQNNKSNKNVVFIHGAWSTGEVWGNYKSYFTEQGYNVFSPTFRFHSISEKDSLIGVSMEDYINDLRKVLQKFETPPTVIAHSMGCIIAQRLAMEGLVGKIILIAPPVNYGMMASLKAMKWINKIDHLKTNVAKPTFEQAVNSMLNNLSETKQKEVYASMSNESGQAMKELIWIKNLFGKKPNKINYSKITIPILIISGGKDNSSPKEIGVKLAKKYKNISETKLFENNAHWMIEENNWKEIAEYAENWVKK